MRSAPQLDVAPRPLSPVRPLGAVTVLFSRMMDEEIVHCHWKSNEHLRAATQGETDLDLLVDRSDASRLGRLLAETGYKRFTAAPERGHAGIEDYLGLDDRTGTLLHLHLHYRLVLGEKFLKGYCLPWERVLLSGRVLEPETGLYISAPEAESVLLAVRAAMKLRGRDVLLAASASPGASDDLLREARWLAQRVDRHRLLSLATELLGPVAGPLVPGLLDDGLSRSGLRRFRRAIAPVLEPYRAFSPSEARRLRWSREWRARWGRARRRLLGTSHALRFGCPRGGLVIALLGADGSGKSTLTQALQAWLGWKLEVLPLYLGFGDGPVSPTRRPLQLLKRMYARRPRPGTPSGARAAAAVGFKAVWRILYAWSVAREKQGRLERARRARHVGSVVIADRYPQAQVMGMGDGPLLAQWSARRGVLGAAARWELGVYRRLETVAPDLVIKLHVSPEVSARRKQDGAVESLAQRAETVHSISFPPGTRVVDLNADQPLDAVLLQAKRAVWDAL
jgi:thymidylate kinase